MNYPPFPNGPYYYDENYYKKAEEKRTLRSISNSSGVSLIILLVSFNVIGLFLQLFVVFAGGVSFSTAGGIEQFDSQMYYAMQGIISVAGMTLSALLLSKMTRIHLDDCISFKKKVPIKRILALLPAGLAVFMFSNYAVDLLLQNLSAIGINYEAASLPVSANGNMLANILYIVSVACVPAFVEEFLFRGVLLGVLRKYGTGFAVLMSSILFGLMHGNIVQIPFAFIGGLAMAYLTVYTGSIIPAVILHFCNNFFSVLGDIINQQYGGTASTVYYTISMGLVFLLGLMGLFFLSKKDKKLFAMDKAKTLLTLKEKFKVFFATPGIIIAVILIMMQMLLEWVVL